MNQNTQLIEKDIHAYLKQHESKDLLRFITCGGVDEGKSTLIGRLLYDSKMIYEDQLASISKDSVKHGTTGGDVDLALLVDGLQSEREQGITIDVAYRYFSTNKRKFIIADTPGHEQYTRNMATGASTADLAVLLIDARHGVQAQTRRHSYICSLLGIKHFVIAINKMDLMDYSEQCFDKVKREYSAFAEGLNIDSVSYVPLSALAGQNVVEPGDCMPWYDGPCFLDVLHNTPIPQGVDQKPMRFPVQYVNRPNLNFRGYCGTLASGHILVGDTIKVLPSNKTSTVKEIVTFDGNVDEAIAGDAVTLTFTSEIDISRGDMIVSADDGGITASNVFLAEVVWMNESPLQCRKSYKFKVGASEVSGMVVEIIHKKNVNTLETEPAHELQLNEIGFCKIECIQPLTIDRYSDCKSTGGLIFIDRLSNVTVGAGMVCEVLKDQNVVWHSMDVNKASRAQRFKQKPAVIWFTGLSGSGKSTAANALEKALFAMGFSTYVLDGDNVRHGLCSDLGFTDRDRVENIRRVGEVAKLMVDAGQLVLVSFISPFRRERQMVRQMVGPGEFFEVYVNTPLSVCEQRDPKGLYKKARSGEIRNFTGIDSPYEAPDNPELEINADLPIELLVSRLIEKLRESRIID